MGWRDLLAKGDETVTLPWLGGRSLRSHALTWTLDDRLPREHGWYTFSVRGRKVCLARPAEVQPDLLVFVERGYLVGDRLIADGARVDPDPRRAALCSEPVHLLDEGLDRFARVAAGRIYKDGPLVYRNLEMPLGPETEVLGAYLDQQPAVGNIKGVAPALDAAFRMETWQREETERRRRELERLRREAEERRLREERRQQLVEKLGDGAGRREMAKLDFTEAARAALAVGGAELLDDRKHGRQGEHAVRYRLDGQRFECLCDDNLAILDAGICLQDHETGERGDKFFTLESLPAVIRQAIREHKLVIFRHV